MKLFKLTLKINGHIKEINKGGSSLEDAYGKILVDYRKKKAPELLKWELIEDYGENVPVFNLDAETECDKLREKIINNSDYHGY